MLGGDFCADMYRKAMVRGQNGQVNEIRGLALWQRIIETSRSHSQPKRNPQLEQTRVAAMSDSRLGCLSTSRIDYQSARAVLRPAAPRPRTVTFRLLDSIQHCKSGTAIPRSASAPANCSSLG